MLSIFTNKIDQIADKEKRRAQYGLLSGSLGLLSNILLFLMKFFIGVMASSVSIMADAINNLSDAASSILTLVGFKIAAKPADKEHPYGHERFEYISGFLVSLLITFVGFQFLISSFKKILNPEEIKLSPILFVILILSILVKIWQSRMYLLISKKITSQTLKATSQDSLNDVITTAAVLFSALVELLTGWHIDGIVGFLLAIYIIFSGLKMLKGFVDDLMGTRPTAEEIQAMEDRLASYDTILGYHDLLVHSYGPQKRFASVHIEVDENWNLNHAHEVIDAIEKDFREHLDVELVCHLDPVAIDDEAYRQTVESLKKIVKKIDEKLRIHDFRIEEQTKLSFDVVVPQHCAYSDEQLLALITKEVARQIGERQLEVTFDHNYLL